MKLNASILRRILWPEQASMFVIVGGAAGIAGDMASFFTAFVSPIALVFLFIVAALGAAYACFKKASDVDSADAKAVETVAKCGVCDALRFSLFAAVSFALLLAIGQGQTATETVGEKLGLIQKDVAAISSNVQQLSDMSQSHRIISKPKSAQDYFTNAWIYTNIQRDQAKAFESMEGLYNQFGPEKLDAAELFYTAGRQVKGSNQLIAQMEELAAKQKDATLLVVAARNASDATESERLYAAAQSLSPELPFAYWDLQNQTQAMSRAASDPSSQSAFARKQTEALKLFLQKIGDRPSGHYFYLPQYQPDHEMMGRQSLTNYEKMVETYDRLEKMRTP